MSGDVAYASMTVLIVVICLTVWGVVYLPRVIEAWRARDRRDRIPVKREWW
jgi:hypothetical protein